MLTISVDCWQDESGMEEYPPYNEIWIYHTDIKKWFDFVSRPVLLDFKSIFRIILKQLLHCITDVMSKSDVSEIKWDDKFG